MLFTYPIQAIADNWIHDCIQAALEGICGALDTQQAVPAWPEVIPENHRKSLAAVRKLPELLREFEQEAAKLSPEERNEFLSGFRNQNQIVELLSGTLPVPVFRNVLQPLMGAAKAVCFEGFSLLGRHALRDKHYKIIYNQLKIKACPFCGLEPFEAPSMAHEDDDHYLVKNEYPLAAANLANLVPMGGRCNQRYKGTVDILHDENHIQRKALDPYGHVAVEITLINSHPTGGDDGRPAWNIEILPDVEETRTWYQVFSIRERLTADVLNPRFYDWISDLRDWFALVKLDSGVDNTDLSSELNAFANYKNKHREQGADFFKGKVFEFLAHHFSNGNEPIIALIRECLPEQLAA
jgi:hypothetical protein